jgi:hypothetical protein
MRKNKYTIMWQRRIKKEEQGKL